MNSDPLPCCGFGSEPYSSFFVETSMQKKVSAVRECVGGAVIGNQSSKDRRQTSEKLCAGDSNPRFGDYRITDYRRCLKL